MDEKQLKALANELAKNLKTPEDLSQFDRLLKKISVEAALNAEMTHHLGYEKNQSKPGTNSRNGYSTKTVITGVVHWNCVLRAIVTVPSNHNW
ncbi:transposase [Salmonella enterica subsp. enterica serovar Schwarzengrund]|jgi:transposase-like protein|nr:transposase [Salmonella enterica subsp. enterica serovar Schwarzengrund]KNS35015.1 transposase [Salmonella enterica subsp. enterica serovar Heidelberg]OEC17254.1 transposase [Salmonella enterica subsp. enterica serovar Typhimurium]SQQ28857.1 transposase [Escherichia coli]KNK82094.1 transposase [Salmonella enterica subsp. enterica serovar Schwarzengrund]